MKIPCVSIRTYLLLSILVLSHRAKASIDDDEEFRFDKKKCIPGPHAVNERMNQVAPNEFNVRWKTSASEEDIVVQVHRDWAPIGADRFYNLILDNYYNCAAFFRVVPEFVVQFGLASEPDLTSKWSTNILDDMVLQSNRRGTISYAMAGPNTRTTQVFVNLRDNHHLDKSGFAPFGEVVSGMEVLLAIFNPTPEDSGGVSQDGYTNKGNSWILEQYPDIDLIENTAMFEGEVNP